ncbi:MAG: ABC transporter ATP-binding protein [Phycisphaerales bacterium]
MTTNAIELRDLTKRYGPRRGVDAASLDVPLGSLYGFLGPNGAGKTTTIRILLGLLRAHGGSARVLGLDAWRDGPALRREVGSIPGDFRFYPWMDGRGALRLFGAIRQRDMLKRGCELAERFSLDLSVRVRRMSRGMRQKLGLILALAHDPQLLILDEPSTALDPLMQDQLRDELRTAASRGRTVFFSSHSLAEVEALCDRVAIVREGRLVAQDSLDSLRRRAGHEVIVRWRSGGEPSAPPPSLEVVSRDNGVWKATTRGPVREVLAWLGAAPVEDVTIGPPSLESLFRAHYSADGRNDDSPPARIDGGESP